MRVNFCYEADIIQEKTQGDVLCGNDRSSFYYDFGHGWFFYALY